VSKFQFDKLGERLTRRFAGFASRRSFISKLGAAMIAVPILPLLPVARSAAAGAPPKSAAKTNFERYAQAQDPHNSPYWRYCAIDGILCGCCGGGVHTCPAGSEPSPISWIGTCMNPDDGRSYIVAYRDCCGKPICAAGKECDCESVDREMPIYRAQLNNDIVWCFGNQSASYHCSTAALVGVAN
jgi:methylamine dehydrogenase light chain